ncbi:porin [Escherichia coli]
MSTYVDYIINQIDSDNKLGVGSDDTVAVGNRLPVLIAHLFVKCRKKQDFGPCFFIPSRAISRLAKTA